MPRLVRTAEGEGAGLDVSVVVPVYGCRGCLEALTDRSAAALADLPGGFEVVLVDDRSVDGSWVRARELAATRPWLRTLRLSRNFGQHAAVSAGLAHCRGGHVVVMDCDLQDPPEAIPALLAKAREGYDVVLARRGRRPDRLRRRLAKKAYYRLVRMIGRVDVDPGVGNFSVISRKVVDAFQQVGELNRQYLLILYWLGFERAIVDVPSQERHSGSSSYTLRQLFQVALDGLFFQTTVLLGVIVVAGLSVAALGLLGALAIVVLHFFQSAPTGWASLATLTLVLGGTILASVGIAAMYCGRIFEQVKGRPLYVVDDEAESVAPPAREADRVRPQVRG
jgi:glycosyltransferase involved in cell wall biosynthesis